MTQEGKTHHFVGIKGSGMSSLARIVQGVGYKVQGSDVETYFFTEEGLKEDNIPYMVFDADNIQEDQTVIVGNAFGEDHPEVARARELGLDVYYYHEFLGQVIQKYLSVGVTGSHGKTSTTGLLAHTLDGLANISYLIGDGSGQGKLNSTHFVVEACEYRRHFLAYHPDYVIITNIDFDHPDYFKSLEDVIDAFQSFANQASKAVIAWGEDPNISAITNQQPIYYYGLKDTNDVYAANIDRNPEGSEFNVIFQGKDIGRFKVPAYGEHNILNALSVIALLHLEGFASEDIARELATFQGVQRRFSVTELKGLTIIDDYAHHPSEITATIDAIKQRFPGKKVVAIFQPHTFSRTRALLNEFGQALALADDVYLVDIFHSAREASGTVTIEDLAAATPGHFVNYVSNDTLDPLMDYQEAVLVFMGAGNIDQIARQFEKEYLASNH